MTHEEAGRFWPIIKAYSEGKQIEIKDPYDGRWKHAKNPDFTYQVNSYRVKKDSIYRPFENVNECLEEMTKHQPIGWIKSSIGTLYNILEIGKSGIVTKNSISGFSTAINDFVFADGAPFGIKEED